MNTPDAPDHDDQREVDRGLIPRICAHAGKRISILNGEYSLYVGTGNEFMYIIAKSKTGEVISFGVQNDGQILELKDMKRQGYFSDSDEDYGTDNLDERKIALIRSILIEL